MIVTDIVEYSKSKYKIFIDGEFAFVLYKGELRQFKIKKDEELGIDIFNEINNGVLVKRCKLRAMHLLEKRPYSEYVMRTKLKESLYSDEQIDITIDYLKSFKYIDDYSYCVQYIETYSANKSVKRLKQDLMQKGIKAAVIEDAIDNCRENDELGDEGAMIQSILRKRGFGQGEMSQKEIAKTYNYLMNKGFSFDIIKYEMRHYIDDID